MAAPRTPPRKWLLAALLALGLLGAGAPPPEPGPGGWLGRLARPARVRGAWAQPTK